MTPAGGRPIRPERKQPSHRAVVALGANLGDRATTIRQAAAELGAVAGIQLVALSPLVESAAVTPHGLDSEVPEYLNAVALIRTALDPYGLLNELHRIEDAHGRVRAERWGSRTLDLDIVDYGGRMLDDELLTLPHPRAAERAFVLVPWLSVDGEAQLTGSGSVADLAAPLAADVRPYAEAGGSASEPRNPTRHEEAS